MKFSFENYMAMADPNYALIGDVAQDLHGNGIAHSFMTKTGVMVIRGYRDFHLTTEGEGTAAVLYLDCLALAEHFEASYPHARAALVGSNDAQIATNDIVDGFARSQRAIAALVGRLPAAPASG